MAFAVPAVVREALQLKEHADGGVYVKDLKWEKARPPPPTHPPDRSAHALLAHTPTVPIVP